MRQLTLPNGSVLSYQTLGKGTPLLFIHAPGIGSVNFDYQKSLADTFQIILPDLRGHGDSTPATKPFSITDLAYELKLLIEHLGVKQLVLCGYSQGGSVALEYCLRFPEYITGVILVSSFSEVNEFYLHSRFYMAEATSSLHATTLLSSSIASSHLDDQADREKWIAHINKTDAFTLHQFYTAGHHYNCTGRLYEIHVPVLLVYGANDKQMFHYAKILHDQLPNAQLKIITGVKHQIITKAADSFNQLIREFVESLSTLHQYV